MIVHYMYKKFITKCDVREYPSVLQSKKPSTHCFRSKNSKRGNLLILIMATGLIRKLMFRTNFDFLFLSTLIGSLAPLPLIHTGVTAIPSQ